jgi:hypothetical protein
MIVWNGKQGMTDASELEFPPGRWPLEVRAQGPDGVERVFTRRNVFYRGREVESARYAPEGVDVILLVLND